MIKKSMIKLYQVHFHQIKEVNGIIYVSDEAKPKLIADAESLFFQTLYRIQDKQFPPHEDKTNTDVFILKTPMLEENKKSVEARALYQRIIQNGINWNGQLYKRTISSTSMKRDQRTMFVRAELKDKLEEYLSLGKNKTISECLISKYEASIGLSLSSAYLIENKPNICVIEDFEKVITEDVLQVRNYREKESDVEENNRLTLKKENFKLSMEKHNEAREHAKQVLTAEYLSTLPNKYSNIQKAKTAWKKEGRYIKAEELSKPVASGVHDGRYYPIYDFEQTEEMTTFPNTPFMVGKEMEPINDYPFKANVFDGMGICSFEWADSISKELGLVGPANAFQFRNIMMKGLLTRFDFKAYFKSHGVTNIKDMWDDSHDIEKIDIIMTESQFKAALEKAEGKSKWLFSSIQEYQKLLDDYGFTHIGICNVAKPVHKTNPYIKSTYQHLQAFNLPYRQLVNLAKPTIDFARKMVTGTKINDVAYAKVLLGMYPNDDEETDYELRDYAAQALDINHEMILDPQIRKYMASRAKQVIEDIYQGRLFVKGFTNYLLSDVIAFAEWSMHRDPEKVKGYLSKGEFYCEGKDGRYAGVRNPCTHFSEVVKMEFVGDTCHQEWINHLDNVIQMNIYDLSALRAGGADLDGDQFQVYDNQILLRNIIDSPVIIPCPEEEKPAKAKPLNDDAVLIYEMFSLSNAIGQITNVSTYFSNRANSQSNGDPSKHSFECGLMKIWQGYEIDSQKTFHREPVPEVLMNNAKKKPYFMRHVDFGDDRDYEKRSSAKSPLNQLVVHAEDWLKKIFRPNNEVNGQEIDGYESPTKQTYRLLQDNTQYTYDELMKVVEKLKPIYEGWLDKKEEINQQWNISDAKGKDERKEHRLAKSKAYKELNEKLRELANAVHPNPSVVASAAVQIAYVLTKSKLEGWRRNDNYSFPWITTPNAIIANLLTYQNQNKIDIYEVPELNHRNREFAGLLKVNDGIARIDDISFKTSITDGTYRLINVLGKHYIDKDVEREAVIEFGSTTNIDLPPIADHEAKLMWIGEQYSPDSLSEAITDKVLLIGTNDKGYLSVFDNGHYVASIRREDIKGLDKYQGRTVSNIRPNGITNKTISVVFDVV